MSLPFGTWVHEPPLYHSLNFSWHHQGWKRPPGPPSPGINPAPLPHTPPGVVTPPLPKLSLKNFLLTSNPNLPWHNFLRVSKFKKPEHLKHQLRNRNQSSHISSFLLMGMRRTLRVSGMPQVSKNSSNADQAQQFLCKANTENPF